MLNSLAVLAALTCATAVSAQNSGTVAFIADSATYLGRYCLFERTLSVDIDGMHYRGNFEPSVVSSAEKRNENPNAAHWGKAFLFASSAKILQCTLDSGFPSLRGSCTTAEGRRLKIEAQSIQ